MGEAAFVKLVVREAGLLTRLEHAHLCACHEMGVIDGCAFFTLDLVEGCTLRALLKQLGNFGVTLPTSALLAIAYQLASVLEYLHLQVNEPLIHLDISPQNVMVGRQGGMKLIDFGISRFVDGHAPPPYSDGIVGTIGYMSPEQANNTALDPRADQYALGILLWEMSFGQRLFRGNTPDTWRRMRAGELPDLPAENLGRPQELQEILTRMLRPDANERFANLGEVREALRRLGASVDTGIRPLSALVNRLLGDPEFDPFDAINVDRGHPTLEGIPTGEIDTEGYEELSIEVDQGDGTPAAQVRALLPMDPGQPPTVIDTPRSEPLAEPHVA